MSHYGDLVNACEGQGHERHVGYPCARCIESAFDPASRLVPEAEWRALQYLSRRVAHYLESQGAEHFRDMSDALAAVEQARRQEGRR